ncbi:glycosyltransferase family 4 protein [Halochromatium glycolicum]|uniref:Uncharacterized protein n=1 Tax=Halochromatium glycolicum TaxID=85075 RepID=A0AAJ0U0N5_9GAMM|nr:glycosyltransferase family 4 protein [Halochromatium glycolicum]MBK1703178.1 hypothetical protein [Halochromatium glycolicum]
MKAPRVLFVRGARGIEDFSGAESLIVTSVRGLEALGSRCMVVLVVRSQQAGSGWIQRFREAGVDLKLVFVDRAYSTRDLFELPKLIRHYNADVVHPVDHRADVVGVAAARLTGRAAIATYTGWTNWDESFARGGWYEWADRQALKSADAIIVDSRSHGVTLGFGSEHTPRVVIPNGINIKKFDPDVIGRDYRARLFDEDDVIIVGMVGRIHPNKGQHELVEAAAMLAERYPRARYAIVGESTVGFESYKSDLLQKITERGLNDVVRVTNFSHPEIPQVFAAFDCLAAPSYIEGISFTILEAMAMRLPVVSTDAGGTPEIISHEENGLLVPPGDVGSLADGISRLFDDQALRERLGRCACATIEQGYTIEVMARRNQQTYHEVLAWREKGAAGRRDDNGLRSRLASAGLGVL